MAASAVAVNVIGEPDSPAAVAVSVLVPAVEPSVQLPTLAIPDVFVLWVSPEMEPPPEATAKMTSTSLTGSAKASVTWTEGWVATDDPGAATWLFP